MSPKAVAFAHRMPVEESFAQLLTRHDDPQCAGFIIHLDRTPVWDKRNAFTRSVLINLALLLMIVFLIAAMPMHNTYPTFEISVENFIYLAPHLIVIWAIYSMLVTTTIPFFFGECRLRMRYGFRSTEVVFRKPPVLDTSLPYDECIRKYQHFIARSMDPSSLWSFMTSELSSPVYPAAVDAYQCIDRGDINEENLESAVWRQENGVWNVVELCKAGNVV